ncbi:hypothetical protein ACHAXT_013080 [Thalassiosira profunda]
MVALQNGGHRSSSSRRTPPPSGPTAPNSKEWSSVQKRRLLIALAFAFVCVLRWEAAPILSLPAGEDFSNAHLYPPTRPVATAAYAVSITTCGKMAGRLFDAAAVLRRSIELNSWPLNENSRYGAKFYAFMLKPVNPSDPCAERLALAGWEVVHEDAPIYPDLIKEPEGSALKMGIRSDGCCGDRELIKLATYKLTDHQFAVHLDLDTLVVHPFDELFDVMHFSNDTAVGRRAREKLGEVVAPTYFNRRQTGDPSHPGNLSPKEILANITVDAYFTKDYNMIVPGKQHRNVGIQGGFLVVRPSYATYTHLISLVYSGEFYGGFGSPTSGWFKKGYGRHIWGSMTIQGLMAYYFDVEQLEHSVELNRCRYNNIADNARVSTFARNPKYPRGTLLPFVRNASNPRYFFDDTQCRDGRESCDETNCQRFPVEKARVLHYTYCKMPYKCNWCNYLETYKEPTCYAMVKKWFEVRSTLPGEGNRTLADVEGDEKGPVALYRDDGEVEVVEGNCFKEFYLGYCLKKGEYVAMQARNLTTQRSEIR